MYTWKEIPIEGALEEELKYQEEQFISSLAHMITQDVMASLRHLSREEMHQVIQKIRENPNLLGTLYFSPPV